MIEPFLSQAMMQPNNEKSFIDKVVANKDIESVRDLIKKSNLTRDDISELGYVLSNVEIKLVDLSPYERYVLMKYAVWVGETVRQLLGIYEYKEKLERIDKSETTKELLNNSIQYAENLVKSMINLFFMITRSSLSVNGKGIDKLMSNKFEVAYPSAQVANVVKGNEV